MRTGFLKTGFLLAALSVILGAFGAHALKEILNLQQQSVFETAVRYQFYHVFAIIVTGILYKEFTNKRIILAGYFFIAGIILFSGSLYALCYVQTQGFEGLKWLGPVTPLGGLCFIIGWILMFAGIKKNK
jgi:uncharacterized membrane protein YgdD (TMEM256/DUF423 family)